MLDVCSGITLLDPNKREGKFEIIGMHHHGSKMYLHICIFMYHNGNDTS